MEKHGYKKYGYGENVHGEDVHKKDVYKEDVHRRYRHNSGHYGSRSHRNSQYGKCQYGDYEYRSYQKRYRRKRQLYGRMLLVGTFVFAAGLIMLLKNGFQKDDSGTNVKAAYPENEQYSIGFQDDIIIDTDQETNDMRGYANLIMTEADIGVGEQILVSNEHKYAFVESVENQLEVVGYNKTNSYTSKDNETAVLPVTVEHLNNMMDDFVMQGGSGSIMVVSGYRTYDYQQNLFDSSVARNGLEHTRRYVAQAGGSEHHTGYAVDLWSLNTGTYLECTGEYSWLSENCHKYGFILRYTAEKEEYTRIGPEGWHFRYIGVPHSYIVTENDFCYEEYIDYLRLFSFDKMHLFYTVDGTEYEIYFVEGLEVPVPEEKTYTISGNNVDGFIVTIRR